MLLEAGRLNARLFGCPLDYQKLSPQQILESCFARTEKLDNMVLDHRDIRMRKGRQPFIVGFNHLTLGLDDLHGRLGRSTTKFLHSEANAVTTSDSITAVPVRFLNIVIWCHLRQDLADQLTAGVSGLPHRLRLKRIHGRPCSLPDVEERRIQLTQRMIEFIKRPSLDRCPACGCDFQPIRRVGRVAVGSRHQTIGLELLKAPMSDRSFLGSEGESELPLQRARIIHSA